MDKNFTLSNDLLLDKFNKIKKFSLFDEIDSTNEEAKRTFSNYHLPSVIIAKTQTNGKGRMGRSFYSEKDTGAYFTLLLNLKDDISNSILVTSLASVVVADTIKEMTNLPLTIKWVNDIYLHDKKTCGILSELVCDKDNKPIGIIVGIGINLESTFPDELHDIAGNIGQLDLNTLISRICENIAIEYQNIEKRLFIEKYKKYSNVLGKEIYFIENGKKTFAKAIDIDNNGSLVVLVDNKEKILSTGEITIRTI